MKRGKSSSIIKLKFFYIEKAVMLVNLEENFFKEGDIRVSLLLEVVREVILDTCTT